MSSLFSGNLSSSHISAGWDASNFQAFRQPVKKAKRGALEKTPQGQALEHNSGLAEVCAVANWDWKKVGK